MPIYVYETVPAKKGAPAQQYEFKQSMRDAPLTHHPETGEPLRRVISGGFGYMTTGATKTRSTSGGGHSCASGGCGCGA